jgi:RNA 3'-terminal phosphate cyclase (GTP)
LALSIKTGNEVEIRSIRAGRPVKGLRPQHVAVISMLKEISNASINGLYGGSERISFKPGNADPGHYDFDIKTAGSITLVFQALILSLFGEDGRFSFEITGGTDVKWSPPWDHFENVFIPLVRELGIDVKCELLTRGYYPEGCGKARLELVGSKKLNAVICGEDAEHEDVRGRIHLSNLPEHIGSRMRDSAEKELHEAGLGSEIEIEHSRTISTGTGITLWSGYGNSIMGSSSLGERGVPAEEVGRRTATTLIEDITSGADIDIFTIDQILPYLAMARGSSFRIREVTGHLETNIWVVERFLGPSISVTKDGGLFVIRS